MFVLFYHWQEEGDDSGDDEDGEGEDEGVSGSCIYSRLYRFPTQEDEEGEEEGEGDE